VTAVVHFDLVPVLQLFRRRHNVDFDKSDSDCFLQSETIIIFGASHLSIV